MIMAQDCPQCHYTPETPKKKEEKEECSQCFYTPDEVNKKVGNEDECSQCFYDAKPQDEPETCSQCFYDAAAIKQAESKVVDMPDAPAGNSKPGQGAAQPEKEEECSQCFYTPDAVNKKIGNEDECSQCFYDVKPQAEPETCSQCFYDAAGIKQAESKVAAAPGAPAGNSKPGKVGTQPEKEEECSQCFYVPDAVNKKIGNEDECSQCFYDAKPQAEPETCSQCFYDAAAIKAEETKAEEPKKSNKVIIYSMPECGNCRMVMDFLKARGIAFEDILITTSKDAQNFMNTHGYRAAPVVVIGEKHIVGAQIPDIKKALGL